MEIKQASVSALTSRGFLLKGEAYNQYKALVACALNLIALLKVLPDSLFVYITKPSSLPAFYENMVNELLLATSVSLNRVSAYKKRLSGYIVYFKEKAIAKHFSNTFPRTLLVGTKVHMFDVIEILTFH